jgi:hypothetical protein
MVALWAATTGAMLSSRHCAMDPPQAQGSRRTRARVSVADLRIGGYESSGGA